MPVSIYQEQLHTSDLTKVCHGKINKESKRMRMITAIWNARA